MGKGFGELALELLFHIFSYLYSAKDLCRCSMVCKKWRCALADSDRAWAQALNRPSLKDFRNSRLLNNLAGSKKKLLVALDNAWDGKGEGCSKNIYLLENKLTLHRNPVAQSTDGIRGKCGYLCGQHYWAVTWHRPQFGSNAVIGVVTESEEMWREGYCALLGSTGESWGWDISQGRLRHAGQDLGSYPLHDKKVCSLIKCIASFFFKFLLNR